MALNGSVQVGAVFTQTSALDIATGTAPLSFLALYNWSSGTGQDQVTTFTSDNRTLGAGANDDFDLAGGLVDIFGNVVTFTRIRAFLIEVDSAAPNALLYTNNLANNWVGPLHPSVVSEINLPPGSTFGAIAPDQDGFPVVQGTDDILRIRNPGAGACNYSIMLLGTT